jgi:hypothetical protein
MTEIRFQADADLRQAIVTGAIRREPNLDFRSANEAGLEGIKDPEVLALAAQDCRVLVTHDRKTIPTEFGQFITSQTSSGSLYRSSSQSEKLVVHLLTLTGIPLTTNHLVQIYPCDETFRNVIFFSLLKSWQKVVRYFL